MIFCCQPMARLSPKPVDGLDGICFERKQIPLHDPRNFFRDFSPPVDPNFRTFSRSEKKDRLFSRKSPLKFGPPKKFLSSYTPWNRHLFAHDNRPGIPRRVKKTCSPKSTIFSVCFSLLWVSAVFFHHSPGWMLVSKVKTVGGSAHGYIHCSLCRLAIAPDVSKKPIEVWLHLTNVDGNMVSGDTG